MSQPLNEFISSHFSKYRELLTFEGFSKNIYKTVFEYVNNEFYLTNTKTSILINLSGIILCTLIFISAASINLKDLILLKYCLMPLYLPFFGFWN